eukprot:7838339-Pyramimonas_sp.AAC.1
MDTIVHTFQYEYFAEVATRGLTGKEKPRAPESIPFKGLLNQSSKLSALLKIVGSRKFSSAHSSCGPSNRRHR